jgi:hypothetical protein
MDQSRARPPSSFEEACALADAEEASRSESDEVAHLAKLPRLEYDRQREDVPSRNASAGTRATTAAERSAPGAITTGPADLTAPGCTVNARPPWFDSESCAAGRPS